MSQQRPLLCIERAPFSEAAGADGQRPSRAGKGHDNQSADGPTLAKPASCGTTARSLQPDDNPRQDQQEGQAQQQPGSDPRTAADQQRRRQVPGGQHRREKDDRPRRSRSADRRLDHANPTGRPDDEQQDHLGDVVPWQLTDTDYEQN